MTSRIQNELKAYKLIKQAFAVGWNSDALVIDYAVALMGSEHRDTVERVYDRDWKVKGAN